MNAAAGVNRLDDETIFRWFKVSRPFGWGIFRPSPHRLPMNEAAAELIPIISIAAFGLAAALFLFR
jgi:hypothetical protein